MEIRSKLQLLLYIFRRPMCERSIGIGTWLNIWEFISFISVFTNFALLYFKETDFEEHLPDIIYDADKKEQSRKMWIYIWVIVVIIALKRLFKKFILDKPQSVLLVEEKLYF